MNDSLEMPATRPEVWPLDPGVVFLNHGSFGSCPRAVLECQADLRRQLEARPVEFLARELEVRLDVARVALAKFVGVVADDLVFVPNATAGVNTVLRSLRFAPGDELLVTSHEYNACRNALNFAAAQWGAQVVEASPPFPLSDSGEIVEAILAKVTSRTRLALLDHVTSQTGLVLPLEALARELTARGVEVLVDGAHAPGMVPLEIAKLGVSFYTGNCHKWICAPKGAAFLWVRRDWQERIRPLVISHGANSVRADRSRFQIEFGWTGTWDPTAMLCVPEALKHVASLLPGGWPAVMCRNRELALAARAILCEALSIGSPCPDEMIGALASVPLPDAPDDTPQLSPLYNDPLQARLREEHQIEVPIIPWPAPPKRLLRIAAQLYNALPDYRRLAAALR